MKLVFAAPESGLPSWLTALVEQVSAMHFFMNEVLAAPANELRRADRQPHWRDRAPAGPSPSLAP
jgi:hypothetical protein